LFFAARMEVATNIPEMVAF